MEKSMQYITNLLDNLKGSNEMQVNELQALENEKQVLNDQINLIEMQIITLEIEMQLNKDLQKRYNELKSVYIERCR